MIWDSGKTELGNDKILLSANTELTKVQAGELGQILELSGGTVGGWKCLDKRQMGTGY